MAFKQGLTDIMLEIFLLDFTTEKLSDYEWRYYLSKFLHGPSGGKYQANFRFKSDLKCGEPAPNITVIRILWFHIIFAITLFRLDGLD